jgi:hypothetical protein
MPNSTRIAPTLLVTAKFSVPVSGPSSSMSYAVRAYADTLSSSKNTNRLNRSPVRQNPIAPARKTSISVWNSGPVTTKYRVAKMNAATNIRATKQARPAPMRSTANETPSATPPRGSQPPNQ